ncbi:hypothetical protein ZWY2020_046938 [Hordeum vulgare]|nr:hypothetical protein ZWY2020_046938 [Hordeum vulgare]
MGSISINDDTSADAVEEDAGLGGGGTGRAASAHPTKLMVKMAATATTTMKDKLRWRWASMDSTKQTKVPCDLGPPKTPRSTHGRRCLAPESLAARF